MKIKAYLAGPDVFLPDAREHALRKVRLCSRHDITGYPPLNEDIASLKAMPDHEAWRAIFRKDLEMMEACDIIIANLTPFRGPSADAGTLVELGWFLGRGRPVFGYSNAATPFAERSLAYITVMPDPVPGLAVEGFGLPDNLMISGAVLEGGGYPVVLPADGRDRSFEALDVFERCLEIAAWKMKLRLAPAWLSH
jgi:nucleoside 2-deoxyribosyltransferase